MQRWTNLAVPRPYGLWPPGPGASVFERHVFERSMRCRLPAVLRAYLPWVLVRSDFFKASHREMELVSRIIDITTPLYIPFELRIDDQLRRVFAA